MYELQKHLLSESQARVHLVVRVHFYDMSKKANLQRHKADGRLRKQKLTENKYRKLTGLIEIS